MKKSVIGSAGEKIVADYIRKKGLAVIRQNYRTRFGEIDVIAESQTHIIFIEVKTRNEDFLVGGTEAVDFAKQRRIRLSAEIFMNKLPIELEPRFDVAEVVFKCGEGKRREFNLKYIEDAF